MPSRWLVTRHPRPIGRCHRPSSAWPALAQKPSVSAWASSTLTIFSLTWIRHWPPQALERPPHMSPSASLPEVCAALFPAREVREPLDHWLTGELMGAHERVLNGSVTASLDMARFRAELARYDFRQPQAVEPLLAWIVAQLEQGVVHMTHPRYFGLF